MGQIRASLSQISHPRLRWQTVKFCQDCYDSISHIPTIRIIAGKEV